MSKRMLIDTSHPEETRVAVVSGSRLEEFDYESAARKQLKGNIYLAKVIRVEPSLQAAFVEYGGNRHGFLPFSEIHPDYYRIPVADREALIAEEASFKRDPVFDDGADAGDDEEETGAAEAKAAASEAAEVATGNGVDGAAVGNGEGPNSEGPNGEGLGGEAANGEGLNSKVEVVAVETGVDIVGGDDVDDAARRRARLMRRYKIQEVIKRRQVLLIQVTKEERGNKGAALTTYLSLAGRYCVLMPNTARGGGISRKISGSADRRRLKSVIEELDIPEGVAVIVRTAGSERSKPEIRRDYDYLLRLWNEIRESTMNSTAPALIYEEANLIKRAIRDLYRSDMEDILVEGEDGYKAAKAFMKSLMPSHARNVKLYKDPTTPIFQRYAVETQIDAMHSPVVQLKSGGYLVINATEALVAIDVNSGKATRERHIEETAYKTNSEASDEIARQLRLRDLAGLIVIDFIDMEESRHDRSVERRLKEALRTDRARIQLGRISPFGLLEMSRQRLRPSLVETTTTVCPTCKGTGHIRTTESMALHILRVIEEDAVRRGGGQLAIAVPPGVALHLLNQMRVRLVEMEQRHGLSIRIDSDEELTPPEHRVERLGRAVPVSGRDDSADERKEPEVDKHPAESDGERRRGRRRRGRGDDRPAPIREAIAPPADQDDAEAEAEADAPAERASVSEVRAEGTDELGKRRRRRGKRGGRRRGRQDRDTGAIGASANAEAGTGTDATEATAASGSADAELPFDVAPDGAAGEPAPDPAPEAAQEKKARPRRTRGGRKRGATKTVAADGDTLPAAAVAAKESADDAEPAATATASGEPAATAEAKPRRRRRGRPTPDQGAAAEPALAAAPALAATAESEKPAPAAHEPAPSSPVAEPAATGDPGTRTDSAAADNDDDDQPRRRGWWQRWG